MDAFVHFTIPHPSASKFIPVTSFSKQYITQIQPVFINSLLCNLNILKMFQIQITTLYIGDSKIWYFFEWLMFLMTLAFCHTTFQVRDLTKSAPFPPFR